MVVPQNLRSVFALAAQSSGELANGGACAAYRCGLRVLCGLLTHRAYAVVTWRDVAEAWGGGTCMIWVGVMSCAVDATGRERRRVGGEFKHVVGCRSIFQSPPARQICASFFAKSNLIALFYWNQIKSHPEPPLSQSSGQR